MSLKFSAPKIWENVPPGLKCVPYHKLIYERMEVLSPNQPNLTLLISSITDIIWVFIPFFTAANYFNMKVSNKKALATLDTVHKWT